MSSAPCFLVCYAPRMGPFTVYRVRFHEPSFALGCCWGKVSDICVWIQTVTRMRVLGNRLAVIDQFCEPSTKSLQTAVATSRPIHAVDAIASALQKVTRIVATRIGAPPARASTAPSNARNNSDAIASITSSSPQRLECHCIARLASRRWKTISPLGSNAGLKSARIPWRVPPPGAVACSMVLRAIDTVTTPSPFLADAREMRSNNLGSRPVD